MEKWNGTLEWNTGLGILMPKIFRFSYLASYFMNRWIAVLNFQEGKEATCSLPWDMCWNPHFKLNELWCILRVPWNHLASLIACHKPDTLHMTFMCDSHHRFLDHQLIIHTLIITIEAKHYGCGISIVGAWHEIQIFSKKDGSYNYCQTFVPL